LTEKLSWQRRASLSIFKRRLVSFAKKSPRERCSNNQSNQKKKKITQEAAVIFHTVAI